MLLRLWGFTFFITLAISLIFKIFAVSFSPAITGGLSLAAVAHALFFGLKFDAIIAAAFSLILTTILFISYFFAKKTTYLVSFLFALLLTGLIFTLIGEWFYLMESGRHLSYEVKDFLDNFKPLIGHAFHSNKILFTAALFGALFLFLIAYLKSVKVIKGFVFAKKRSGIILWSFSYLVLLVASTVIIRGGLNDIPIAPIAVYEVGNADKAVIATNGAYNFLYGLFGVEKGNAIKREVPVPEGNKNEIFKSLYHKKGTASFANGTAAGQKKNLVILFLESWSSVDMNEKTTPNYFNLEKAGISPEIMVAGGLRTTEGLFSTLCSFQNPLGGTLAQSRLENNKLACLPDIFTKKGFNTAIFQGCFKNTVGTGVFAKKLGFQKSFGKEDIPSGKYEKNAWGYHDYDVYQFVLSKIAEQEDSFFFAVSTNTTHDSQIPKGIELPFESVKLNLLHFADKSLGLFFQEFKARFPEKYKNTLFVVNADHTAGVQGNTLQRFVIPGFVFAEGLGALRLNRPGSQRDFAPTVLDYFGLENRAHFTGKSWLRVQQEPYFAELYSNGKLAWIEGQKVSMTHLKSNLHECFRWKDNWELAPEECSNIFTNMKERALSFTNISQDALFNNKVMEVNPSSF